MKFLETDVADAQLIDIEPHGDDRGFFARVWCTDEFAAAGADITWVQANVGFSPAVGTLRGMHLQRAPYGEWKLVRCTSGRLYDVVLDLRPDSPSYLRWYGAELSAGDHRSLLVPPGCAHGYQTLEPDTELLYMTSHAYQRDAATGVRFDDPAFGIEWPLPPGPMSEGDRSWPLWAEDDERSRGLAT